MNISPLRGPLGPESAKPIRGSVEVSKLTILQEKIVLPSSEKALSELSASENKKIEINNSTLGVSATAIIVVLLDIDKRNTI